MELLVRKQLFAAVALAYSVFLVTCCECLVCTSNFFSSCFCSFNLAILAALSDDSCSKFFLLGGVASPAVGVASGGEGGSWGWGIKIKFRSTRVGSVLSFLIKGRPYRHAHQNNHLITPPPLPHTILFLCMCLLFPKKSPKPQIASLVVSTPNFFSHVVKNTTCKKKLGVETGNEANRWLQVRFRSLK